MKKAWLAVAVAIGALHVATPAMAQTRYEQQRWDEAQRRYQDERARYEAAVDRDRRRGGWRGDRGRDPYATDWDAARYYRDDARYTERRLGPDDQVYRGSDGRWYCRRSDGTAGLIIGGGVGALIGNVVDGGRNRAAGTIIGGALGALVGREVQRDASDVRCR